MYTIEFSEVDVLNTSPGEYGRAVCGENLMYGSIKWGGIGIDSSFVNWKKYSPLQNWHRWESNLRSWKQHILKSQSNIIIQTHDKILSRISYRAQLIFEIFIGWKPTWSSDYLTIRNTREIVFVMNVSIWVVEDAYKYS